MNSFDGGWMVAAAAFLGGRACRAGVEAALQRSDASKVAQSLAGGGACCPLRLCCGLSRCFHRWRGCCGGRRWLA